MPQEALSFFLKSDKDQKAPFLKHKINKMHPRTTLFKLNKSKLFILTSSNLAPLSLPAFWTCYPPDNKEAVIRQSTSPFANRRFPDWEFPWIPNKEKTESCCTRPLFFCITWGNMVSSVASAFSCSPCSHTRSPRRALWPRVVSLWAAASFHTLATTDRKYHQNTGIKQVIGRFTIRICRWI